MARPSNTAERRAQIVDGLLRAMAKHGYQRASIQAIANEAGLAPGLVHYHFKRKQDILLALVAQLTQRLEQRTQRYLDKAPEGHWAQLDAWVDGALALSRSRTSEDEQTLSAWVFVGAEALRQSEVREVFEKATADRIATVRTLLAAVLAAEGRTTRPARRMAALALSTVEGAYQLGLAAPGALPSGFSAPMLKQALRGLVMTAAASD